VRCKLLAPTILWPIVGSDFGKYWIWGICKGRGLLQALSSAVQPRALWLAAHHYELAPTLDPGWAHLLQSLSTSLGVHDDDAKTRRYSHVLHSPHPHSPCPHPPFFEGNDAADAPNNQNK
jgi:hypothetical protein